MTLLYYSTLDKGIIGALGALVTLILFWLFHFFKDTSIRYFHFLRHKKPEAIGSWEIIGLSIIVFFIVWIASFSILYATISRRDLSEGEKTGIAAIIGAIACASIIYSYWQHFKFKSLSFSWMQQLCDRIKRPKHLSFAFNSKSDVSKFNFYYSFKLLPEKLSAFSNGRICFSDAISSTTVPVEYQKIASKIKSINSGLNNKPDLEMTLMEMPSTKSKGEVNCIIIIRNTATKTIALYTLEYSLQDFCVCHITESARENLGVAANGQQFAAVALQHFFNVASTPETNPENSHSVKSEKCSSDKSSQFTGDEEDFFELVPQKDIFGQRLTERVHDIFLALKDGVDKFIENLYGLPCLSEQGKMEVFIVLASLLSIDIQKEIVIQSLMTGDKRFQQLGIKLLDEKIETYASMYKNHIRRDFVKQSWSLLDFARNRGSLKICEFKNKDSFGYFKRPVFCKDGEEPLICHFASFETDNQTPAYISAHKENIIVEEREEGKYVLITIEEIGYLKECFVSYVAYHVLCHPLKYYFSLNYYDIDEELGEIPIKDSSISFQFYDMPNPTLKMYSIIRNALEEGKNDTEHTASVCGLI